MLNTTTTTTSDMPTSLLLSSAQESLSALSQRFLDQSFGSASDLCRDALTEFWSDSSQSDLLQCLFPTHPDLASNSIRPCYPHGGYDPRTQKLSEVGLRSLMVDAWDNIVAPPVDTRWTTIDGLRSNVVGKSSGVANVVGLAIKPVSSKVIVIDIDLDFFSGLWLSPELSEWLCHAESAYRVRGNPQRMALVFRQSKALRDHIARSYAEHRVTYCHREVPSQKIEISIRDGSSNNVAGMHKSGALYQVLLPSDDAIGELSLADFEGLIAMIEVGFKRGGDTESRHGRMTVAEMADDDACDAPLNILSHVVKGVERLRVSHGVSGTLSIYDLISISCRSIINGETRYAEANQPSPTVPGSYLIPDGYRRNTTWQAFSEVAFVAAFLEEYGVRFDPDEEAAIVRKVASMVQPDEGDVIIPGGDGATKVRKWGADHVIAMYADYRDDETRRTISPEFAPDFIRRVSGSLGNVLQDFFCAAKIKSLPPGMVLAPPNDEQLKMLADSASDPASVTDFNDLFEEIFEGIDIGGLLDSEQLDEALERSARKVRLRKEATSDDWSIFPGSLGGHQERRLSRQAGGSFPAMISLMAGIVSFSGIFQVTADPIDDATFESLAKKGRKRYELDSTGSMLTLMHLLTGDSGAGKSYVSQATEDSIRVASRAINHTDPGTEAFFSDHTDERGKLAPYNPIANVMVDGKHITSIDFAEIAKRVKGDVPTMIDEGELFAMSDHTADIAAIRDAMMVTEYRLILRQATQGKLFSSSFAHAPYLFFDEGGSFIEQVYIASAKIAAFCELESGRSKEFRRARSNASGTTNSIQFWAACMHANIPIPKFMATAYRADLKECKAEGVLGRILVSYVEGTRRNIPEFKSPYGGATDAENITTVQAIAMIIPGAVRRYQSSHGKSISFFGSTGNLYFTNKAVKQLQPTHDRIQEEIGKLEELYPSKSNKYGYSTYRGKVFNMLYRLAGAHKLSECLVEAAERLIPLMSLKVYHDDQIHEFNGWEITQFLKNHGMQSTVNCQALLNSVLDAIDIVQKSPEPLKLDNRAISVTSLKVAEKMLSHHYSVLAHSENIYLDMFGGGEDEVGTARKATAVSLAERHSTTYLGYRVVVNLDRQLSKSTGSLRQSDVLRNLTGQAKRQKPEDVASSLLAINTTFNTIIGRLVHDGHLTPTRTGTTWEVNSKYSVLAPLLTEIKAEMIDRV